MNRYYVNRNAQPNGDHEVHTTGCSHPAAEHNRVSLGLHAHCRHAVAESRKHYSKTNGCLYCCPACHTG